MKTKHSKKKIKCFRAQFMQISFYGVLEFLRIFLLFVFFFCVSIENKLES